MRAVCVEQSPGSGRCVRGNAGARPGAAKQHADRKRKRKRRGHEHLSPVKPVKPLEADR